MHTLKFAVRRIGLALAVAALMSAPASAYKFPGSEPSLGSAVASKVIGQHCAGTLTGPEAAELTAYITQYASEMSKRDEQRLDQSYNSPEASDLIRSLTSAYAAKYRDSSSCTPDAAETVRDTLAKVRLKMAAGGPAFPDETDPAYKPHIGAAVSARVVGDKCQGTFTGLEAAQLEFFIARAWLHRARDSAGSDSRYEMKALKSAERDMSAGWRPADCTPPAIATAKAVAAAVAKELAATVQ